MRAQSFCRDPLRKLCEPGVLCGENKFIMSLLIKNGRVITADADYVADIFIEGEIISAIGKNLPVETGHAPSLQQPPKIIDASGMLIFPGGIDPHVHLDMPFMGTF